MILGYQKQIVVVILLCGYFNASFAISLDSTHIRIAQQGYDKAAYSNTIRFCDSIIASLAEVEKETILFASFMNIQANAFRILGEIEKALSLHRQVLAIRTQQLGKLSMPVANTYQNIGNCLIDVDAKQAIQAFQKALHIRLQLEPHLLTNLASTYLGLGYAYQSNNDQKKAQYYFEKAMNAYLNSPTEHQSILLSILISFGNLHFDTNTELAKNYFQQALDIQIKDYCHPNTALLFHNLGNCTAKLGNIDTALAFYREALTLYEAIDIDTPSEQIASICNSLGDCFLEKGDMSEALRYYQRGLTFCDTRPHTPTYFAIQFAIGSCYRFMHETVAAIQQFEQVLAKIQDHENKPKLLKNVYESLANCYWDSRSSQIAAYYAEKALSLVQASATHFNSSDRTRIIILLGKIKLQQHNFEEANLFFKQTLSRLKDKDIYFKAECYYYLSQVKFAENQLVASKQFLNSALSILNYDKLNMAQSKEPLLICSILLLQAKVAQANAELDSQETLLELAFNAYLEAEAFTQAYQKKLFNLASSLYWNDHFDELYDGMVNIAYQLISFDPTYHQVVLSCSERSKANYLKSMLQKGRRMNDISLFSDNDVSFWKQNLQQQLQEGQSILNYHVTQQTIVISVLQMDTCYTYSFKKDEHFEDDVRRLYGILQINPRKTRFPDEDFLAYAQLAHYFYQRLIAPVAAHLGNHLTIIPDKLLVFLPFEALLCKPVVLDDLFTFHNHDYLIRHLEVSYGTSLNLWVWMKNIKPTATNSALVVAPIFDAASGLNPLNYNIKEAKNIKQIWGGQLLARKQAREAKIKELLPTYNILHFATHGVINLTQPNLSYLALDSHQNQLQDGRLQIEEILNMELSAELVFLGACQTNIGKYYQSEGVMSLARAFTYAGAKSIVASLWSIDDEQTSTVTKWYYQYLKKSKSKSAALRQAKLDYLLEAEGEMAHPYYWSALVLIGDSNYITIPHQSKTIIVLSFGALVFLLFIMLSIIRRSKVIK